MSSEEKKKISEIGKSSNSKSRDISGDELNSSPQIDIGKEIEKNILIRVMPRKFKVSTTPAQKGKTKAVGAIIMIIGLLIMAAAAYLVYMFLINPQKPEVLPVENKPVVVPPVEEIKKPEIKVEEKKATTTNTDSNNDWVSSTTTVDSIIPTSTNPLIIIATSSPTSTTPLEVSVLDTDNDGLSDAEEILLGINISEADSDGDGYSDKSELIGLYNPAGAGKLSDNPNIASYKDSVKKYSVLYPSRWRTQGVGDSVIFSSPDNSFVQIIAEANIDKKTILTWHNNQFSDSPADLADVIVKNGWEGIYYQDKQIFYLTDNNKENIYTFSYVPVDENNLDYYNIFQVMINSFILQ